MEKGAIMPYLLSNPTVDRLKLVGHPSCYSVRSYGLNRNWQISQIASGLEYLHTRDPPIVHGNLTRVHIYYLIYN